MQNTTSKNSLFAAMFIPTLIITLLLASIYIHFSMQKLNQNFLAKGESVVRQMSVSARFGLQHDNQSLLQDTVNIVAIDQDIYAAMIFNHEGKLLAYYGPKNLSKINYHELTPKEKQLFVFTSNITIPHFELADYLVSKYPITSTGKKLLGFAAVQLNGNILYTQQLHLFIVTFIILLLINFMMLLIARKASQQYTLAKLNSLILRNIRKEELPKVKKISVKIKNLDSPSAINSTVKKKILVAEDNKINIKLFNHYFNHKDIELTIAEDGQKAVEMSDQVKFDLIMLDMQMPHLSGLEVSEKIRHSCNKDTPIIILSAQNNYTEENTLKQIGVNEYLLKPISEKMARRIMNAYLFPDIIDENLDLDELLKITGGKKELALEMIEMFKNELPSMHDEIRDAFAENNYDKLYHALHKLNGAARYSGYVKLTSLVADFENCVKENKAEQYDAYMDELNEMLEKI